MPIRQVPAVHTELLRLLCGGFGTSSKRGMFSNQRVRGQSDGANAQHLAGSIIALLLYLNYLPICLLLSSPLLCVALLAATTHKLVRPVTRSQLKQVFGLQVHKQSRSRWGEKVGEQWSYAPKCPSKAVSSSHPTPPPPFNCTCYHNNDSDK